MPEPGDLAVGMDEELKRISAALHELCQPLTTLQCRLEMAELVNTSEGYREAVVAGLVECARLVAAVGTMRESVRSAMQHAPNGVRGGAEIGTAR